MIIFYVAIIFPSYIFLRFVRKVLILITKKHTAALCYAYPTRYDFESKSRIFFGESGAIVSPY